MNKFGVPIPTIRRLPSYLRVLQEAAKESKEYISGTVIANALQLEPIQVRKDLAMTGITGRPGVGFVVKDLILAIESFLGWHNTHDAIIIGAGSLGDALAGYEGFGEYGLNIVAAFDNNPLKIGKQLHGKTIFHIDQMIDLVGRMHILIAILTVPGHVAQDAANLAVMAGIKGLWNFTPTKLEVPGHIIVEKVDLAASLAVLSKKLERDFHSL
jgi:redox-sensing transcriptional repressor